MKKTILYILAIILLFLSTGFGYIQYKKSSSYKGTIHEQANTVLKIDTYNIAKTLALDYISNPSHYNNKSNDTINKLKDNKGIKGISIPFNLFVQTLPNIPETHFCILKIDDNVTFEKTILKKFQQKKINVIDHKQYKEVNFKSLPLGLAWNTQKIILYYTKSSNQKNLKQLFNDIFVLNKTLNSGNKINLCYPALLYSETWYMYWSKPSASDSLCFGTLLL